MTLVDRVKRLYYTVKPLRYEQIIYRIRYKFFPLKAINIADNHYTAADWCWSGPEVICSSLRGECTFEFLGLTGKVTQATDWNNPSFEKLWLYNLHYFDDLNAINSLHRRDFHSKLILRWIKENPAVTGNGWEPYPISLRIVNWVKWFNRTDCNDDAIVQSIALQAEALSKQLEYHILGNHLFANAKALIFAGCFLKGDKSNYYLDLGLKIIHQELTEQFLADGGHFELSPMYHCILLWDLLDLINLSTLSVNPLVLAQSTYWKSIAAKALEWLSVMQHPDGDVSFFNDSAIGIAASPAQIFAYAKSVGLDFDVYLNNGVQTLLSSGYSRVTAPSHVLILDHAAVGPDYLPGHAHADTLSFEWSVDEQRVFVNSGTSIYGVSAERLRQRQTAAHNTVIVDGQDSSEVWSGFRVARRAYATLEHCEEMNGSVRIVASHNGYQRLNNKITHRRIVHVSSEQLSLVDEIVGEAKSSVALFHLHPAVKSTQLTEMEIELLLPNGIELNFRASAPCRLVQTTWHPHFGESVPSMKIEVPFHTAKLSSTITFV
jgi:uncharacterized heparinase superfamily protein